MFAAIAGPRPSSPSCGEDRADLGREEPAERAGQDREGGDDGRPAAARPRLEDARRDEAGHGRAARNHG